MPFTTRLITAACSITGWMETGGDRAAWPSELIVEWRGMIG